MSPRPTWLPELIECHGDWGGTLVRLHAVFERDFVHGRPRFRGKRVWWDRKTLPGQTYTDGFWHLITQVDPASGDRVPEFRRAERLCWCRPMLEHPDDPEMTVWNVDASGRVRTYLWLQEEDFAVILQHRDAQTAILITAYHLDGEGSRRKLRKSYANKL
jgi:hypothetical protein